VIHIPDTILEEIFSHARSESPDEVCGWLAGSLRHGFAERNGGGRGVEGLNPRVMRFESQPRDSLVEKAYSIPNIAGEPKSRFVMEPEAQISAMRKVRELGLELVGTYHSHPGSPARPSEKDRELALYPDLAHLIVSLAEYRPSFRCWWIAEGGIVEVEVERGGRLV
jgi:proteasome lid subunit RPN8/RPN11